MEKLYRLWAGVLISIACLNPALSQDNQPVSLGKSNNLLTTLKSQVHSSTHRGGKPVIDLPISSGNTLKAKVNFKKSFDGTDEYLVGAIENNQGSDFFIKADQNSIEGNIVLRESKRAFKYFSDSQGNAFVQEVDINDVVCIEYDNIPSSQQKQLKTEAVNATPMLESFPGAKGCVLLDFDGQYVSGTPWNGGNPINATPSGMSDAAVQECWEIVAEDFRPFHVNVTTNEAVFNSYPKTMRMRCIITPTNTAAPGAGGVAYVGSFRWNDDTPCWVFITSAKGAGEASSHEVGHTFGLNHDGRTNPSEGYFQGHGSWAPIMGVGYYRSVTQWSKGEYNYANNKEDDLAKITSTTYNVGYRNDDHGNTTSSATALIIDGSGNVSSSLNNGIIERTSDVDMFRFTTSGGTVTLNFNPAQRHADLDILATLYNSSGTVISTHNPSGLSSSLSTSLAAGTYYLSINGTGAGDLATNGYSEYASLGSFSISGKIPVGTTNQNPIVSITSPANGSNYSAPASITISATASDADGSVTLVEFYNGSSKLGEDASSPYSYTWDNVSAGSYTLNVKATDNTGASTTASVTVNVINLRSPENPPFTVNGLEYQYYEGSWNSLPNFSAITPAETGFETNFNLSNRNRNDQFGFRFTGFIDVPVDGNYTFYTTSDDGSRLYIGTTLIVNNDGLHGAAEQQGSIGLQAGKHSVTVIYFEQGGDEVLNVSYAGPGITKQAIPNSALFRVTSTNQVPSVSITSPANNAVFDAGTTITFNANASDSDGSITLVEFFNGTNKLGEDASSPYTFTWNNVQAGNYTITAKATDNQNASTTSTTISITVRTVTVSYCTAKGNNTTYEYINRETLGSINNTSGANNGYGDFTSLSTTLNKGASHTLYVTPGFSGSSYRENWVIWIDYNQDGDFTDGGEVIVSGSTSGSVTGSASFTVPTSATSGNTRMRVAMQYGSTPSSCGSFSYGEVEDYTVMIADAGAIAFTENRINAEPLGDIYHKKALLASPNPVENTLIIEHIDADENSAAVITDLAGIELKQVEVKGSALRVDVTELKGGIYIVNIRTARGNENLKFVKLP